MSPYPGEFPDIEQANEQARILNLLKAAGYGAQPEAAPQLQGSPGIRTPRIPLGIAGLHIPSASIGGGALDELSAAALNGLNQGGPQPTSGGGRFAQGFIRGYAGSRAGGAQARLQQYQGQSDAVGKRNEARQKLLEKFLGEQEQERATRAGRVQEDELIRGRAKTAAPKGIGEAYFVADTPEKRAWVERTFPHLRGKLPPDGIIARSEMYSPPKPATAVDDNEITDLIETNSLGAKYLNMAHLVGRSPEMRNAAIRVAQKNGASMLTKEQSDAVANVDVALTNVQQLSRDIEGLLPKDAEGRITGSPTNKLRAYFQTSDDLAAWGSNRNRAIQILRAAAGSHGLRINEAEILYSMENDIPKIDDTEATALRKLKSVREQLENVAKVITTKDRRNMGSQSGGEGKAVDAEVKAILGGVK